MVKPATVPSAEHPPSMWQSSNRLIQPHRIGFPITITDSVSPIPESYYVSPIHPWVLRLDPHHSQTFHELCDVLGIHEFLDWAYVAAPALWTDVVGALDASGTLPGRLVLGAKWLHPETGRAVASELAALTDAYDAASTAPSTSEAIHRVLNMGWERETFKIELDIDLDTGMSFERPSNLWARCWFELLDGLGKGRPPKPCMHCGGPFVPNRSNQRFCTGTRCRERHNDRRRASRRRAYNTDYQRRRRAKKTGDVEEITGGVDS